MLDVLLFSAITAGGIVLYLLVGNWYDRRLYRRYCETFHRKAEYNFQEWRDYIRKESCRKAKINRHQRD